MKATHIPKAAWVLWGFITLLSMAFVSCDRGDETAGSQARIAVRVRDEFQKAVAGKTVEIPALGITKLTDENGIAEFTLSPGPYVVRAYGLGMPGPGTGYVDREVSVAAGETTVVEFLDCRTCVAPDTSGQAP